MFNWLKINPDEDFTRVAVVLIGKAQQAGLIRNQSPAEPLYRVAAHAFFGYEAVWCIKRGRFDRMAYVRHAMENIFDAELSLRRKFAGTGWIG